MPETSHPAHNDVIILEEEDCDGAELTCVERDLRNFQHAWRTGQHIPSIDLTQQEEKQRDVLEYEIQILNELEGGTVVEVLQRPRDQYCWQFLHVLDIYTDISSRNVVLRGIKLTRTRNLRGMLPRMKNEVCALYDINKEDSRPEHIQAALEIPVTQVIRTRALSRTNAAFPTHRFNLQQWDSMEQVEEKGVLVQRWKFCRYWPTSSAMASKKSFSGAVIGLRSADIEDEDLRVTDDTLRNTFRGGIIRGGSSCDGQISTPTIDLDAAKDAQNSILTLKHNQKYTADDMFCGAGGASCGIRRAGLRLRLACDFDEAACQTYRGNFPEALLNQMNIFNFAESETPMTHSDCLHISPPCQVWSPAHTCPGQNDEANVAALFACGEVLQKLRPRLSTSEQTFGLLFDRNEEFFNALVGQYTALGYSFSWDVLRFKEYRIPSSRRRLIWIASCPGEALPPFPLPTNGENGNDLPAPVTVRSVLTSIIRGSHNRDPLHNVDDMLSRARNSKKFPRMPYNDRCQVGTVTTSGSEWAHPSGKRNFTLRELAAIQGFPREHNFVGTKTQINRQIGNAFPPVVVEILYRHLKKWLLRQDQVVPRRREASQTTFARAAEARNRQDIIVLDPIDEVVVASRPSRPKNVIIIDDDDDYDDESRDRGASISHNEQNTGNWADDAILIDDSGDTNMIDSSDSVEDQPSFSRESSRTLSAESLPSLIEMELDDGYNVGDGRVPRRDVGLQRKRTHAHHWSLFNEN
ncbi:S-adenosyl-L-methionine-dependent methyltransferase [Xylaria sp. FL1777]|nr:S-adenosyl-L-methionine-dependent methyltransferase [Xylaria sp. FL1777]